MIDIRRAARLLGGDVSGRNQIVCPGPGHSSKDRSLSVRFEATAPDGFIVHSFAGDDPIRCRDHVRQILGLPQWQPNEPRAKRLPALFATGDDAEEIRPMTEEELERVAIATAIWNEAQDPRGTLAETYLQDHRKLDLPLDSNIFRFHPQCPWRDEDSGNVRVPALIAAFRSLDDDAITGIHRIALNPDGTKIDRRMLGIVRRSAIKLAAPCNGELVIAEGIETAMAAIKLGIGPAWALGSAGRFNFFPVLPNVRHLILAEESDEASRSAVKICARRWRRAGRRTSIVSSEFGSDLNDAVIEMVRVAQ